MEPPVINLLAGLFFTIRAQRAASAQISTGFPALFCAGLFPLALIAKIPPARVLAQVLRLLAE